MTALQQRMLELVLEVDAICKKHRIVYYLSGGSVLGAVRHKGFIPWDDDIDIMMTREEFAKFQQVCSTELAADRELITQINTPCHTKVTIKYMNKSTSQFFRSQVLDTTGCGISLDIFVLDPLPRDPVRKEQHIAEYVVYNELLTPFFMVNEKLYQSVDLYRHYHRKAQKIGKEKVLAELYHKLFEVEPEESDLYLYRWGQQHLIYDRSLFGTPRYMDFEGYSLPMPEKTIDFLRATYGDTWCYLPPNQQRETHVSFLSTTVPYINWLEDIRPFQDREKMLADFVERKRLNVEKAVPAHDLKVAGYRQTALAIELELRTPAYSADALSSLSDPELLTRMGQYLSAQLNSGFLKNDVYIDLPDPVLALLLSALMRGGDFVKAAKLLTIRQKQVRELSAPLAQCLAMLESIRKYVRYFEDRGLEPEKVAPLSEIAPGLLAVCRENPAYLNLQRCRLQLYLGMDPLPSKEALEGISEARSFFPGDPEIAFWAGCIYEKIGLSQEAVPLFVQASATSNGLILDQLKNKQTERNEDLD
ncbi:MAG: LicD family protein [Oscillospiraceae bacterium]|nr:LicD family protein [Oscillospiraceae bacterium]